MTAGGDPVDVVVVGSGPNGLAAAVTLARSGLSVRVLEAQATIGGGARTLDLGLAPGVRHDLCSAVHPLALASPFFRRFDLRARGVEMCTPEVSYAHPVPGGPAGIAYRSLDRTVEGLGADGRAWRTLYGPLVEQIDDVVAFVLGDRRHVPPHLLAALRFAVRTLEQGTALGWGARFDGPQASALMTGVAAHAIGPLPSLPAAGTALLLGALAHSSGWPVPRGGTQEVTDALVADLERHGGAVETGREVRRFEDLGPARAYVFDTTPGTVARVLGDRLPHRAARAFTRFRHGGGAAKVDFVLSGPVPWRDPEVGAAGTVHLGGTRADMVAAERAVASGRHADRPVVLVSDPAVSDPTRTGAGGRRPLWTYAHVPAGSGRDLTEVVTAQLEREAPGFRDVVVTSRAIPASDMSRHNAGYVGGDISGGAITLGRLLLGPRPARDPFATGVPGVYLCSASVPPGPGVHGMGGWHAARRVLRDRFGVLAPPDLAP